MLPLFFRHYDGLVDHYFIRDNQSTDGSLDILRAHPRVTILPLFLEGDSMVEAAFAQVNQFWHPSRGQADWVAVCNVDELFWHIDLEWYLRKCQKKGITFLRSRGYQMVGQNFAEPGDNLVRMHRYGTRDKEYDKPAFFNPNAITDSGFGIARHSCKPKGHVVRAELDEILLLHYKYLGEEYVRERHAELNARRRTRDIERSFGWQYDPGPTKVLYARFMAERREVVPAHQGMLARYRRRLLGRKIRPRAVSS